MKGSSWGALSLFHRGCTDASGTSASRCHACVCTARLVTGQHGSRLVQRFGGGGERGTSRSPNDALGAPAVWKTTDMVILAAKP